jgi:hypothetical protein
MIRAVPASRAAFSFSEGRLGATGPQITQGIYTGIESGAMLIPVVGPFVAAAAAVANAFGLGKGCGVTCTQATQIVNQIEPVMRQNVAAAQQQATANGGCLLPAEVAVLTQNFQTLWQQVLSGCGQLPAPGGTQCIADRQPGGKYDWTAYYLTPIQQIPVCPTAPPPASDSLEAFPVSSSAAPSSAAPAATNAASPLIAATTPATIAGFPSTYVYLALGALGVFLLVQK